MNEETITTHHCETNDLPLADGSLDRFTARNTLIYVDDPAHTIAEAARVLKPGGRFHAIEGDWPMMVVEPLPSEDWQAVVAAAAHACRTPDIGRKLYGYVAAAGFTDIQVQLLTRPDTEGRLLGMVKNMVEYARASGALADRFLDDVVQAVDHACDSGTYLALAPQFVVTATRS